ncbi:pepsin-like aspartic protease [Aspergillus ibericus CBS 121593]|uniref:Probable aspartic-type endopeptidase OPSB n=1 Tax=Aspergillus ibericus CBS 121593 TaxID=1448316 RepID=A0A395H1T7_9EURO|nr:secreted aspartic protease [Aspergillus ibericus CBS 121593]RAL00808.1 secreted aspartic protease [Aspergillus ibericus CBS 121593]
MKSTTLLSLAWATQSAYAASLHQRDEPATLALNFERRQIADRPRRKRSMASAELVNLAANLGYTMNLTLGTPGQKVSVTLDTGSSDLWVNAGNSSACPCTDYGTYNSSDSSTYVYVNDDFEIQYVDNSEASGDYVNDTLQFANVTLTDFTFAVAYDSDKGVFGIGYAADEASEATGYGSYTNFPEALVDQGIINWPAYSLWLDDLDSGEGTILFGGVNTAKYYGSLKTLPIIPESDGYGDEVYAEFAVNLTAVHLEQSGKAVSVNNTVQQFPIAAVLDSGTALAYIPSAAAESIFTAVGAEYSSDYGYALVDCSVKNEDFTFYFEFASEFNITVDISEMVIEDEGVSNICTFGLSIIDDEALLGDTFLRSAYVVYDLGNNEISIAQANFDPGTDHVLEIGTGSNAVPNATGVAQSSSGSKTGSSSASGTSSTDDKKSLATMSRSDITSLVGGLLMASLFLTL